MIVIILLGCTAGALAIYFGIVKPLMVPLNRRIPTDPRYLPKIRIAVDSRQYSEQMARAARGVRRFSRSMEKLR